jgi:hypothetical protein
MKTFLAILVAIASAMNLYAQQPQSSDPIIQANARTVNGVGPGYYPTRGAGLVLNVSAGTSFCTAIQLYAGGTLTMAASTTNNVYLDTTAACAPAVKTTAFVAADIPIAQVTTSGSAITNILDVRTHFSPGGGGSGGTGAQYDTAYFSATNTIKGYRAEMPVAAFGVYADGGATTTIFGTFVAGTTGVLVGGCGSYGPNQGNIFIVGAGVGGADYSGAVVSCTVAGPNANIVVNPATSTNVTGAYVQHDNSPQAQLALDWAYNNQFCWGIGQCAAVMPLLWGSGVTSLATTVQYRGESMHGVDEFNTIIKCGPHADCFRAPDKADSPAKSCCNSNSSLHDMTVMVDASADANTAGTPAQQVAWAAQGRGLFAGSDFANYFTGWTGMQLGFAIPASGAVASVGFTALPPNGDPRTNFKGGFATDGWFQIDAEWFHYHGVATTGCPGSMPFCVLSVTRNLTLAGLPSTQALHAVSTSVAPVNPLAPANVTDWMPANTVGACAFAFGSRDGAHLQGAPFQHGTVYNMYFTAYGNSHAWAYNNVCGWYDQGTMYAITMHNIYGNNLNYGIVNAPAFTNTDQTQAFGSSSDSMTFDRLDMNVTYPFVFQIGGHNTVLANSQFYAGSSDVLQGRGLTLYPNPCHSYAGSCQNSEMSEWSVLNHYQEWNNGNSAIVGFGPCAQIGGFNHTFISGFMNCPAGLIGPMDWSASYSNVKNFVIANIQLNGSQNTFAMNESAMPTLTNNGLDNRYSVLKSQYGSRAINVILDRPNVGSITTEFAERGAIGANESFWSMSDLHLLPADWANNPTVQTLGTGVLTDVTMPSPYNQYLPIAAPGGIGNSVGVDGLGMVIGQRFPKGTGTALYLVKAVTGGGTQTWYLDCQSGHAGTAPNVAMTGAWQWIKFTYDSTTAACPVGGAGGYVKSDATSNSSAIQLGAAVIVPDYDYLTVSGLMKMGSATIAGTLSAGATTLGATSIGGTLVVSGLATFNGGIAGLAPLVLQPPLATQIPLTLDTQASPTGDMLRMNRAGVTTRKWDAATVEICLVDCAFKSSNGAQTMTWNSFGSFVLSNGFQVTSGATSIANAAVYDWIAHDLAMVRLAPGTMGIGTNSFGTSNGVIAANTHQGQFLNLFASAAGSGATMVLTGAAGSVAANYYGCWYDRYNLLIGCAAPSPIANGPVAPTAANYYTATLPIVATASGWRVCRTGGYATSGWINAITAGPSGSLQDQSGGTFLPGDGTNCATLTPTALDGTRMSAMTDQTGGAWLSQWADATYRPVFNDNNTGKKYVVGQTGTIPAGNYAVKAANGIDEVDGGAAIPSAALLAVNMPAAQMFVTSGTITPTAKSAIMHCTGTCTINLPVPSDGVQYCVRNAPGISTVITLAAISGVSYELQDHSAYGTVNHTVVSGGTVGDQVCLVGSGATHYTMWSAAGTWTD